MGGPGSGPRRSPYDLLRKYLVTEDGMVRIIGMGKKRRFPVTAMAPGPTRQVLDQQVELLRMTDPERAKRIKMPRVAWLERPEPK